MVEWYILSYVPNSVYVKCGRGLSIVIAAQPGPLGPQAGITNS